MEIKEEYVDIDNLIVSYLSGSLDKADLTRLQRWALESEEHRAYVRKQLEIGFSSGVTGSKEAFNADAAFASFLQRSGLRQETGHRHRILSRKILYRAAGVILLVLMTGIGYYQGKRTVKDHFADIVLEAPLGTQTKLSLPDGSVVWLNSGSKLTYSQGFGVDNRRLQLEGEGYFEVARNEEAPFEVQTRELNLRVLGTKFNLKNYADDKEVVVSLMEGRVALQNEVKAMPEVHLVPEEQVLLNKKTGEMRKLKTSVTHANCWKDNKLFFDEELLEDIAKKLMRSYAVQINVADSLHDRRFYGDFVIGKSSIREVLDAIAATGRVNYTYKEGKYILY